MARQLEEKWLENGIEKTRLQSGSLATTGHCGILSSGALALGQGARRSSWQ